MENDVKNVLDCPFCGDKVDSNSLIDYEKIKGFEDIDIDKIECMCNNCNYIFFKIEGDDNE